MLTTDDLTTLRGDPRPRHHRRRRRLRRRPARLERMIDRRPRLVVEAADAGDVGR
jgi:hypothetical protein